MNEEHFGELQIIGTDGNAFALFGKAQRQIERHLKEEGLTHSEIEEQVDKVINEAKQGDYNHVLRTMMKYFDVC